MIKNFRITKLADLETLLPGFKKIWPAIKADTGTRCRCPRSVTFTDVPREMLLDDGQCGRRYSLNLETMELGKDRLHVSSGDWAVHAGSNNDQAVRELPGNAAVVSVSWNDYHRYLAIEIQVAKLPEAMTA